MSTAIAEPLAFRCNKCWQTNCTSTDNVGQELPCQFCGHELLIPEASPERLQQGRDYLANQPQEESVAIADVAEDSGAMTDQEIFKQAREEVRAKAGPHGLVCSKTRRFLGRLIDSFATIAASVLGVVCLFVLGSASGELDPISLVILFAFPVMLEVVQWCMTAMDGRTLGKYCVNTKVVDLQGNPPGFFQGVILRSWVIYLLNMVPFFGIADAVIIFTNDSHRCIHDFISGTYVIEAS